MNSKIISYVHATAAVFLALFFLNAGVKKIGEVKLRDKNITEANTELIVQKIIVEQNYEAPYGYDITMNTMRQSGFLKVIGVFQILAGLLIVVPYTRLAGLLTLLPIILNIFLMHLFFDNRPHENVETGSLLAVTVILIVYYYKTLLQVFQTDKH